MKDSKTVFLCKACGRAEKDCSDQPCEAVRKERTFYAMRDLDEAMLTDLQGRLEDAGFDELMRSPKEVGEMTPTEVIEELMTMGTWTRGTTGYVSQLFYKLAVALKEKEGEDNGR